MGQPVEVRSFLDRTNNLFHRRCQSFDKIRKLKPALRGRASPSDFMPQNAPHPAARSAGGQDARAIVARVKAKAKPLRVSVKPGTRWLKPGRGRPRAAREGRAAAAPRDVARRPGRSEVAGLGKLFDRHHKSLPKRPHRVLQSREARVVAGRDRASVEPRFSALPRALGQRDSGKGATS